MRRSPDHDTSTILYIVLIYLSALFYRTTPVPQYPFYVWSEGTAWPEGKRCFVQGKTDDLETETCSRHWLKRSLQVQNFFLLDLKLASLVDPEPRREPMASHDLMFSSSEGGPEQNKCERILIMLFFLGGWGGLWCPRVDKIRNVNTNGDMAVAVTCCRDSGGHARHFHTAQAQNDGFPCPFPWQRARELLTLEKKVFFSQT